MTPVVAAVLLVVPIFFVPITANIDKRLALLEDSGWASDKSSSPIFVSNMAGKVTGGENVKQPNNQSRPKMAAPRAASGISGEGKQKNFTSNDII